MKIYRAIKEVKQKSDFYNMNVAYDAITGYTLQDEEGNLHDESIEDIMDEMESKEIKVVNLYVNSRNILTINKRVKIEERDFLTKVDKEIIDEAENLQSIIPVIESNTRLEIKPSTSGLILLKSVSSPKNSTIYDPLDASVVKELIRFILPKQIEKVYDNCYINNNIGEIECIEQGIEDDELDYSNISYIGESGIPQNLHNRFSYNKNINEKIEEKLGWTKQLFYNLPTRIKVSEKLKHLNIKDTAMNNLYIDRLVISEDFELIGSLHDVFIEELVIDKKKATGIIPLSTRNTQTRRIKKLWITENVEEIEPRGFYFIDPMSGSELVTDCTLIEELHISEKSPVAHHNKMILTNMNPTNIYGFSIKVLDVPEELMTDILEDSLKNLEIITDSFGTQFMSTEDFIRDYDQAIENINQLAEAYHRGTGRTITVTQQELINKAISQLEQEKKEGLWLEGIKL